VFVIALFIVKLGKPKVGAAERDHDAAPIAVASGPSPDFQIAFKSGRSGGKRRYATVTSPAAPADDPTCRRMTGTSMSPTATASILRNEAANSSETITGLGCATKTPLSGLDGTDKSQILLDVSI
jgi:hypothetical protein